MTDTPLARWERHNGVVLAVASLVFLAAYAVLVLGHGLPGAVQTLCLALALAAWAVFLVDYVARWHLSGQRWPRFIRTHWLDTLVLLLPLLRPVRIVQTYEAVQRRQNEPRLSLHARVIAYAGLSVTLLGFAASLALYQQEHAAPGADIRTYGDAVWFTCTTLSTVGYGDLAPVTPIGRLVAVGVMACGLALLGAVTGSFSSWLLQVFAREGERETVREGERPPGNSPEASHRTD
ncbi:potassium channel family protein [Streptomyces sp. NBC_00006]|uniref:potassium channel family protein n=1 Tax=unclassified Streptomyces TaxID=2593676 RepID=UPI002253E13C|nr:MULTISPECIES: potassium channel family protein [unclassified Streptomyces]MCX4833763.1 potassium channel family protein [Streptomyces sp. NBC_01016]MCX5534745.1 potassium channel family protein [Streptomyces sp. NBC_00006]